MAYKSNHRYYSDFMSVLRRFKDVLSDKEFNELVSKFQFDKAYERHKYFEIVSEIIILDFVLRNYNQEKNLNMSQSIMEDTILNVHLLIRVKR